MKVEKSSLKPLIVCNRVYEKCVSSVSHKRLVIAEIKKIVAVQNRESNIQHRSAFSNIPKILDMTGPGKGTFFQ